MIIVDRNSEIRFLKGVVRSKSSVIILSLRGYGKTHLLRVFREVMVKEGFRGVYLNCLRIYTGEDLINIFIEDLKENIPDSGWKEGLLSTVYRTIPRHVDSKEALEFVFRLSHNHGISFMIFDEISALMTRFGLRRPYRGYGGAKAVAEHIKGLLDTYAISVIFADTSLESIYVLAKDYSAPLFKEIKHTMFLPPLSFEDSLALIKMELEKRGKSLGDEAMVRIAEMTYGVPQYIIMFVETVESDMGVSEVEKKFYREITEGSFHAYFKLLFEKFSTMEQEILVHLSRKVSRAADIARKVPGAHSVLDVLTRKGIIKKVVKSEKEVHYFITDKLFEAWLQLQDIGEYKKMSERRSKILSYGFEALMREALFAMNQPLKIGDILGREIEIGPYARVVRYEGALGEIDAVAYVDKKTVDVYEITLELVDKDKLEQLLSKIVMAEKMGLNVRRGIIISYSGYKKRSIDHAKALLKSGAKIYLISRAEAKLIAKTGRVRIP